MKFKHTLVLALALSIASFSIAHAIGGWGSDGTPVQILELAGGNVLKFSLPSTSDTKMASLGTRHLLLESTADNRQVRINSRAFAQATGSSIGFQSKPNQNVTTTGDVIGGEVSPRVTDAGAGALIALRADPVVKDATAARTISAVRALEINIDLPNAGSAYTFTNEVAAIRIFPDFGSGHTFSARRTILMIANPNTSQFDVFMEAQSANGTWISVTGASASIPANTGFLLIRHGSTTYRIPIYANS